MRLRVLLLSSGLLCLPSLLLGQPPPSDAAEISRDLLYHPAYRIEMQGPAVLFRAAQFTYRFEPAAPQWEVKREKNFVPADAVRAIRSYPHGPTAKEFHFRASADDNEAILEIRAAGGESEPLAQMRLWNRAQLAAAWFERLQREVPRLTLERLERELEVSEPEVADAADDGTHIWLALRYYNGEGMLGLGTLVRFDPQTNEARLFQPAELATSSVTQVVAAGGTLWLGTQHEGEGVVEATAGLVRFHAATGELRSYRPGASDLLGGIITALHADERSLWAATDEGLCRIAAPGSAAEQWTCWRIVPTVRVVLPAPVSNRPGGAPRSRLPAGSYEVRWANVAFFETVTPDAMEGWLETDDLEEYAKRQFDTRAYELANTSGGGASVMRLLEKPEGDPLTAAQVYRAPLERIGAPTREGWQRVRARVGWIPRQNLVIIPVIAAAKE